MKGPGPKELLYGVVTAASALYMLFFILERIHIRYISSFPLTSKQHPLFFFVAIPILWVYRRKHHDARGVRVNGCEPANVYPHRDPILGTDWIVDLKAAAADNRLIEALNSYFDRYGNTYWFQSIGHWTLMTSEPENIKTILSTNFDVWTIDGLRKRTAELALGPRAIFSVGGAEWQHARAQIRPSFVRNQLADLECTDRHVENLLSRIPRDGSKVDLQPLFYLFTMDMSTDFMFGYSTNMLVDPSPVAAEFTRNFEYTMMSASMRARLSWILMWLPNKEYDAAFKKCTSFIENYVAEALQSQKVKERPYIFMNELVESGASQEEIKDQLMSMILGGRDTSASTLSALFWILARRPDVTSKLREEMAHLHGEKPSWEQLKNFKYMNMVLKEVLRLYPPVISNMRNASKDAVLPRGGGADGRSPLFVPKGTQCRYSIQYLHRRKDIWGPDADEFRPERWERQRPSWEYIPFSGGPRICIGQQFALTQITYMVTRILQSFPTLEPRDNRPMVQIVSTTTSLQNGCWVSLNPT